MTDQIQWGALVTLPNGAPDVEIALDRSHAISIHANTARLVGDTNAKLVYRNVALGDWTTDHSGGGVRQWGVRETWTDGHIEERPAADRAKADFSAGITKANSSRVVISRAVQAGDWWLAEVTA